EAHEQIDAGPHHAAHDMDPVEEPDVLRRDRGDHHDQRGSDIPKIIEPNEFRRLERRRGNRGHVIPPYSAASCGVFSSRAFAGVAPASAPSNPSRIPLSRRSSVTLWPNRSLT